MLMHEGQAPTRWDRGEAASGLEALSTAPIDETLAVSAQGLVKRFDDMAAVRGVSLAVPRGTIYGILGPNGAGKTTTLRMLLGILDPDGGERRVLGAVQPLDQAEAIGYLPEERGTYPTMVAREMIAFMGAIRGLPLLEGRLRADRMLADHDLAAVARKPIRTLSKGMAQIVQIIGAIVHDPALIVLDEPFSGLDALNQARLEQLIRARVAAGATVLFSTHVIAHAERLCERIAIIADGQVRFEGTVDQARGHLPARVHLGSSEPAERLKSVLPVDAEHDGGVWRFAMPDDGMTTLLARLVAAKVQVETLSVERAGLHDAFIAIAGPTRLMGDDHDAV